MIADTRGHFPTEQAALKCLYLVTRSLDPAGKGRARWAMRPGVTKSNGAANGITVTGTPASASMRSRMGLARIAAAWASPVRANAAARLTK